MTKHTSERFLVCVNNNEHSLTALKFAALKAKYLNANVDLVHVIDTTEFQGMLSVNEAMLDELFVKAEDFLQQFLEKANDISKIYPSVSLETGDIKNKILKMIEQDNSITLVIIGISTKSPSNDTLIPWLIENISSKMQIPIMIIPGNLTEENLKRLSCNKSRK